MSKQILVSDLLEPGAMLQVTEEVKENTFSPGSLGFVAFVRGLDESYQNVAKVSAVMIRRGKGGKSRMMDVTLHVPIFYLDHPGFKKLMPDDGNKKYYVQIERAAPVAADLMNVSSLNFIGYAVAMSKYIKHMSDQCRHKKWPEAKSHPVNVLKRLPEYFEEHAEENTEKYSTEGFRANFVMEARRMISSLVRVQLQLDINRVDVELNAAEFLLFSNEGEFIPKDAEDRTNEYRFTEDTDLLKRTVKYHEALKIDILKLGEAKRTKSS